MGSARALNLNGPSSVMPPYPLHHIAIAVPSIREAAPLFELLTGESCSPPEEIPGQGVRVAFLGQVELLEPTAQDTPVGRFLERRGQGLHHVAFRVPDIPRALAELEARGIEPIDRVPRPGAGSHQVAFLHPRSTGGVLWELIQE
jgi:methylmalonyl-CoA/ethylmalonyl-CoA epimerase